MTDETEQNGAASEPSKPFIHVEFNGELSAEVLVSIDKCSPFMLWGASKMIAQYADDLWMTNQMQQAVEEQQAAQSPLAIARAIPQDHLPRRARRDS